MSKAVMQKVDPISAISVDLRQRSRARESCVYLAIYVWPHLVCRAISNNAEEGAQKLFAMYRASSTSEECLTATMKARTHELHRELDGHSSVSHHILKADGISSPLRIVWPSFVTIAWSSNSCTDMVCQCSFDGEVCPMVSSPLTKDPAVIDRNVLCVQIRGYDKDGGHTWPVTLTAMTKVKRV